KKIAAAGKPDGYRLSFIPPGIAAKTRSALAVHGELVEKEVRAALTGYGPGKISPEIMSDLTIAVRMPTNLGTGKVELVLAAGKESTLTPELKSLLENQLVSATSKVNLDLAKEVGGEFSYASA